MRCNVSCKPILQRLVTSSQACVPIAAPCPQGAAVSAPPPVSFLPAGMPPIPIQENSSPVRGRPTSQHSHQGTRGRSGSSESSSPSHSPPPPYDPYDNSGNAAAASSGLPPSGATCRICGGQHDEINCPYLTMNQPQAPMHLLLLALGILPMKKRIPLGLSLFQISRYPIHQRTQLRLGDM